MRQVQKKLRIAVLYGGRSAEREISIRTGEQIIKHLDRKKYQVVPSEIPVRGNDWISRLMRNKPDVALLALHGPKLTHLIQKTALQIHSLTGARGVTRSDFILRDSTPYFLELNTIPGMTETSLAPQSAEKVGI